ncbi:MAG: O-methyltransferase [Bacilli bacterium]|nr:O-methyltransferase [Bacilli bacterium]
MKNFILEMEEYANLHNVPIIEKESIAFIMKYIKANNIKSVLEIGSAIGYSAILMASATQDVVVTTIERDENRYMECLKNVKKCGLDKKINVFYQDALEVNLNNVEYDLIFIDAAKGQYKKFFEKFKYFLSKDGVIITDNLKFHGYVGKADSIESKNLKSLVQKIEGYIEFLKDNKEFDTKFYDIGDGLSVSKRKDEK